MVRDKAKAERDRNNGKGGGNPKLKGSDKEGVNPQDKAQIPEARDQIDSIGSAGASKFTEGSKALASSLWKALGFETPLQVPINLAGADWRAIEWERAGWTVDLIDAEARRVGPDKPLTYYEKVFATAFAKRQAPLPVVEVKPPEKVTMQHGKTESLSHVARRHAESGITFGERPSTPSLCLIEGGADVRLLPEVRGERPGDICGSDSGGPLRISGGSD